MSRTERQQPRHLIEPDQPREHPRVRRLGPAAAVVGVLLLLLVPVVFVLAMTRTSPGDGTRSASVSQPGQASAAPQPAAVLGPASRCAGC